MARKDAILPGMRDYPREITVNEDMWHVRFVRRMPEMSKQEDLETRGLCDPSLWTIYVKVGLDRRETLMTFIHELLHAFEESYQVEIPHPLIYRLEVAFADFLLHNWHDIFNKPEF